MTHVLLLRYIHAANLSNDESMRLFLFGIFSIAIIFYIHDQLFFEFLLLFEVFVPEFNGYGAFFQFLQKNASVHREKKSSDMIGLIILLSLSTNA